MSRYSRSMKLFSPRLTDALFRCLADRWFLIAFGRREVNGGLRERGKGLTNGRGHRGAV